LQWGDFHFAMGLAQAFERRGHAVTLVFHDEDPPPNTDVAVVLRGLDRRPPLQGAVNVLWSISHPDLLSLEEIESFDVRFFASRSYPTMLDWAGPGPHHTLLQATDRARFYPQVHAPASKEWLLFVGNSRQVDRPIVRWAAELGLPLAVYGEGWEGRIDDAFIKGTYIANEAVGRWYAQASAVLNDHWPSMKAFGYLSNRLFDIVASGGRAISDYVPSIASLFGDAVTMVRSKEELASVVGEDSDDHTPERLLLSISTLEGHSFDNRAAAILSGIKCFVLPEVDFQSGDLGEIDVGSTIEAAGQAEYATCRIGIVPQATGAHITSSAFVRLIQPLTSELGPGPIDIRQIATDNFERRDLDAIIVSRVGAESAGQARILVEAAERLGIPLILDLDDGLHVLDSSHPEHSVYAGRLSGLKMLLVGATEVWCSTEAVADSVTRFRPQSSVRVIRNCIDPRLWRLFQDVSLQRPDRDLSILYAGTRSHQDDLGVVLPALDTLANMFPFSLTIVGVGDSIPDRPWLKLLSPPSPPIYPRFARWMRDQSSSYDVGIAPLRPTRFNEMKSDLKVMEYLSMGLIPLASPVGEYKTSELLDSENLCSTTEDWVSAIGELMARPRDSVRDAMERLNPRITQMWEVRSAASAGNQMLDRVRGLRSAHAEGEG
jgi:glycosyltransferase involved in cell wall biosynthesis